LSRRPVDARQDDDRLQRFTTKLWFRIAAMQVSVSSMYNMAGVNPTMEPEERFPATAARTPDRRSGSPRKIPPASSSP
jgi:hypothetical protein